MAVLGELFGVWGIMSFRRFQPQENSRRKQVNWKETSWLQKDDLSNSKIRNKQWSGDDRFPAFFRLLKPKIYFVFHGKYNSLKNCSVLLR